MNYAVKGKVGQTPIQVEGAVLPSGKVLVSSREIQRLLIRFGVIYQFVPMKIELDHCVIQCDVSVFNGKKLFLSCCGESTPQTLWTEEMRHQSVRTAEFRSLTQVVNILINFEHEIVSEFDILPEMRQTPLLTDPETVYEEPPMFSETPAEGKESDSSLPPIPEDELMLFGKYQGQPVAALIKAEPFVKYITKLTETGAHFEKQSLQQQFELLQQHLHLK